MRVADLIVEYLAKAGVEHVFTVCGGGAIFLCDALAKSKIKYVSCHHEQAATMAAEGYARVRNGLGAVFVTSGPGGTNTVTGVTGAWTDHVPMIVISGQSFLNQTIGDTGVRTLGVQEINIVDIVRPVTKYAEMVRHPELIRWHLEKAIHLATTGRPGPVWLDIPADVQNMQAGPQIIEYLPPKIDEQCDVSGVIELLREAKRPLVHVGQGVRIAGAIEELFAFLKATRIPVLTARNGNDLIASDHELFIGRPGTFAQRGANFAVQTCDAYLAIGTRLCLAQTGYNAKDYARNAKIVMVDVDSAELNKGTVPIDLRIKADARVFLNAFLDQTKDVRWPDWYPWLSRCKEWQRRYPPVTQEQRTQARYVNSYHLVDELSEALTPGDVIVTDMGFAFQNTHQAFRVKQGQRLFTNGGTAAMGWGLPAAIGAAVGSGRRVICIAGDGGLMMNVQELATLAHHGLPVKLFVLNNGGYLTMRQSQKNAFDSYMGSDQSSGLSFPDFHMLAGAFGIDYLLMSRSRTVDAAIEMALSTDRPMLCEVMMDPEQEQVPKSINRREADGSIRQTAIEDAYPFLDPQEIEENLRIA